MQLQEPNGCTMFVIKPADPAILHSPEPTTFTSSYLGIYFNTEQHASRLYQKQPTSQFA